MKTLILIQSKKKLINYIAEDFWRLLKLLDGAEYKNDKDEFEDGTLVWVPNSRVCSHCTTINSKEDKKCINCDYLLDT